MLEIIGDVTGIQTTNLTEAIIDDLNNAFGTKRSILKYGIVEVSIPHDHRVGEIESPSIWKFEFSEILIFYFLYVINLILFINHYYHLLMYQFFL